MNQNLTDADRAPGRPDDRAPSPYASAATAATCNAGDWGVLSIAGADARAFLQGQLSSDVNGLARGSGQWTTYNSPKGRMLANGFLWRSPDRDDEYRLALATDLAAPIRARLAMFVLRSKVTIADQTPATVRIGVFGNGTLDAVAAAFGAAPAPGHAIVCDGLTVVALPDGRAFIVAGNAADVAGRLDAHTSAAGDADAWRRSAVLAGVGLVTAATQDRLLPQAANMDLLGAVALNPMKGCFPGQEVIKRTQALGQLKERLYAFELDDDAPAPGTPIFGASFGAQACGTVVNSAQSGDRRAVLLAVVQIRAAESDVLHAGSTDGPVLSPHPLPYAVPVADAST